MILQNTIKVKTRIKQINKQIASLRNELDDCQEFAWNKRKHEFESLIGKCFKRKEVQIHYLDGCNKPTRITSFEYCEVTGISWGGGDDDNFQVKVRTFHDDGAGYIHFNNSAQSKRFDEDYIEITKKEFDTAFTLAVYHLQIAYR